MSEFNRADNTAEPTSTYPDMNMSEKRQQPLDNGATSPPSSVNSPVNEKPKRPSGIMGFFSKCGDLPEWKFGGKQLAGKSLNYSIGFIASCGFLMFGYDQGTFSSMIAYSARC